MIEFNFEKLDVWQQSRQLVKEIYLLTKYFPDDEKYGLINQLRRAAVSVSSNIAEGNSRFSPKDKSHFTEMAYTSLMEITNQLIISSDLKYISEDQLNQIKVLISEIGNKLTGLYKYQRNNTGQID